MLGESVALIYVYAIAMSPYDITDYVTVKLVKGSHLFTGTMAFTDRWLRYGGGLYFSAIFVIFRAMEAGCFA